MTREFRLRNRRNFAPPGHHHVLPVTLVRSPPFWIDRARSVLVLGPVAGEVDGAAEAGRVVQATAVGSRGATRLRSRTCGTCCRCRLLDDLDGTGVLFDGYVVVLLLDRCGRALRCAGLLLCEAVGPRCGPVGLDGLFADDLLPTHGVLCLRRVVAVAALGGTQGSEAVLELLVGETVVVVQETQALGLGQFRLGVGVATDHALVGATEDFLESAEDHELGTELEAMHADRLAELPAPGEQEDEDQRGAVAEDHADDADQTPEEVGREARQDEHHEDGEANPSNEPDEASERFDHRISPV